MAFKWGNSNVNKVTFVKDGTSYEVKKVVYGTTTVWEDSSFLVAGTTGGLKYSEDDGLTWTNSNVTSGTFAWVVYSSKWSKWFACNSTKYIYTSTDGKSWTSNNIGNYTYDLVCDKNGDVYYRYYATAIGWYNGTSFTNIKSITTVGNCVQTDQVTGIAYALSSNNELYKLSNGTAIKKRNVSWSGTPSDIEFLVSVIDDKVFYSAYYDYGDDDYDYWLYCNTVDGSENAIELSNNYDDSCRFNYWKAGDYYCETEGEGQYVDFHYSSSVSSSFSTLSISMSHNIIYYNIAPPVVKIGNYYYFCCNRYMYRASTINGSRTRVLDIGGYYVLSVMQSGENIIAFTTRGIYVSTDAGASFTQKNSTVTYAITKK